MTVVTLNRTQSWVRVGFATSWGNDTRVTDPDLLFTEEGFYVYSLVDRDYERTYTKYLDCKDAIPCYINLTSPVTAGLHVITFFFNFKLGPANDTRPSQQFYIFKVLDPDPVPAKLRVVEFGFPNTIAYATPVEMEVEQVTADGLTMPFDAIGAIGDNAKAVLDMTPRDPLSDCSVVSLTGIQTLTRTGFTTQIGCFIGGIVLNGGVTVVVPASATTNRGPYALWLPLAQRDVQVLHCPNMVPGPFAQRGLQSNPWLAASSAWAGPHVRGMVAAHRAQHVNFNNDDRMVWVNTSRQGAISATEPWVRITVQHPIASFRWLNEHACIVLDGDDAVVFSNVAVDTLTYGGCDTHCVFRVGDVSTPRRGLHRMVVRYQPGGVEYPIDVPVASFYLSTGIAVRLRVVREGNWNVSIRPQTAPSGVRTLVHMPHSCILADALDVLGNRVPMPSHTTYLWFVTANGHWFHASLWSNNTVYHRACNWTFPIADLSSGEAATAGVLLPRTLTVVASESFQKRTWPQHRTIDNNVSLQIDFYTKATCMPPLTVLYAKGCTACHGNLCDCSRVSQITGLVDPMDRSPIEAIQIQGRTCQFASFQPPPSGLGSFDTSQCAVAELPNALSSWQTPPGVTLLQASGRYAESSEHVRFRPFAFDDIVIHRLLGCNATHFPSITDCDVTGDTSRITIVGQNFPSDDVGVRITTAFAGARACEVVEVLNTSCIVAAQCRGFGLSGVLSLFPANDPIQTIAVSNPNNATVSFQQKFEDECPRDALTNTLCSGNGECNQHTGLCECYGNATRGFWIGDACDACAAAYNNSFRCKTACPAGEGGFPCSNRGDCFDGVCVCTDPSAVGIACERLCPSENLSPCSGHGTCATDQRCDCYRDGFFGFYGGRACSACAEGYSGPTCGTLCPLGVSGSVCSGFGVCTAGACHCVSGRCGDACESALCETIDGTESATSPSAVSPCPGGAVGVCNGHGVCNTDAATCLCDVNYGGTDCSGICPDAGRCSGHGTCLSATATCLCDPRYGGADCSLTCPTHASTPNSLCSGHGICHASASNAPYCECLDGYASTDCSLPCPCSAHGRCNAADGTCECAFSARAGFWTGPLCNTCAPFAVGPRCDQTCPYNPTTGIQCSNNGVCTEGGCVCYKSATSGYWGGSNCSVCLAGYFGPRCAAECPGGACLPCSLNGICSDGLIGTGRCNCSGNWSGSSCNTCRSGHYGPLCADLCPADCGRAGNCSSGPLGTGLCLCQDGFAWDANGRCNVCAPGHFGDRCFGCNTDASGNICSSRGACVLDTSTGNGKCACYPPYGGSICQYVCPTFRNMTCGGGLCVANGACVCSGNFVLANGTCSECVADYFGASCTQRCPSCVHGSCRAGPLGDGSCLCATGYWGLLCADTCPGGSGTPCSLHGTCNATTGLCACVASQSTGFYAGATCDTCDAAFASDNCSVPCPVDANGQICFGRGVCFNGACTQCTPSSADVSGKYCGRDCNTSGRACFDFANHCIEGLYGPGCAQRCPAVVDSIGANSCNGHGFCNADTGVCICDGGFFGAACGSTCPTGMQLDPVGGSNATCSGRGTCAAGVCRCDYGFFGTACHLVGPGGVGNICSLVGVMQGDGLCQCNEGYHGAACHLLCPGMNTTGKSCSGNGNCASTGACVCFNSPVLGFFVGYDCSKCRNGYGGGTCIEKCNPSASITIDAECFCFSGYSGAFCYNECPGKEEVSLSVSTYCNNQGTCLDGRLGNGTCACNNEFYGPSCAVRCNLQLCHAQGLLMAMCDTNGTCVCRETDTEHWSGPTCSVCRDGYWGDYCTNACACTGNGVCDKQSGACRCFSDGTRGYWSGSACAVCQSSYVGTQCVARNVLMTADASASASFPIVFLTPEKQSAFFQDTSSTIEATYTGNQPLVIFHTGTKAIIGVLEGFGSDVVSVRILNASFVVAITEAFPITRTRFLIPRHRTSISFADVVAQSMSAPLVRVFGGGLSSLQYGQRRSFASLAVVDATSAVHGADGDWSIDASGGGPVLVSMDDATVVIEIPFSFHGFATVSSASLQAERGLGLVTGISSITNEWQILRIRSLRASDAGDSMEVYLVSFLDVSIRECFLPSICPSVLRCDDATAGHNIYCLFQYEAGPLFVRIADGITLDTQWASESVLITRTTESYVVTATTYSQLLGYGFVGLQIQDALCQVVKISTTLVSVSSVYEVADGESVSSLSIDEPSRKLAVVTLSPIAVRVMHLLFFGVRDLEPYVIDNRGGLTVTVYGEAFPNRTMYCQFYGLNRPEYESVATWVNDSVLTCTAVASPPTTMCDGIEFNVRTETQSTTHTGIEALRPLPVELYYARSSDGYLGFASALSASQITLVGYMFVASPFARCVLEDPVSEETVELGVAYVDQSSVVCYQSPRDQPSNPGSVLSYSHDGVRFSPIPLPFALVGLAADFWVESVASTSFPAALFAALPTTVIKLVDRLGNEILQTQQAPINVVASPTQGNGTKVYPLDPTSTATVVCVDGTVVFDGLYLSSPEAGIVTILFASVEGFRVSMEYTITPGIPHHVELQNPSRVQWIVGVTQARGLSPTPLAIVADIAGNKIINASVLPSFLEVSFTRRVYDSDSATVVASTSIFAAGTNDEATYEFSSVGTQTVFGTPITLVFTAPSAYTEFHIASLVFTLDVLEKCSRESYGVVDTSLCASCPEFGECDGTTNVKVLNGHWRAAIDAFVFYSCDPPYSATGSCATGYCTTGYTGPRCSVCEPGYGHSSLTCQACPALAISILVLTALGVAVVCVVVFLVLNSISSGRAGASGGAQNTSLLIKLLVNHFQMSGTVVSLTTAMPSFLSSFAGAQGQASIDVNVAFLSCTITPDYFSQYTFTMVLPALVVGVFVAVMALYSKVEIYLAVRAYDARIAQLAVEEQLLNNRRQNIDDDVFEQCVDTPVDVPKTFLNVMTAAFGDIDAEHEQAARSPRFVTRRSTFAQPVPKPTALRRKSSRRELSSAGDSFFLTGLGEELEESATTDIDVDDLPEGPNSNPGPVAARSMTLNNSWFNVRKLLAKNTDNAESRRSRGGDPPLSHEYQTPASGAEESSIMFLDNVAFTASSRDDRASPEATRPLSCTSSTASDIKDTLAMSGWEGHKAVTTCSSSSPILLDRSDFLKSQGPGARRMTSISFANVASALSDDEDEESRSSYDSDSDASGDRTNSGPGSRTSSGGFKIRRAFVPEPTLPSWAVTNDNNFLTQSQLAVNALKAEIVAQMEARHKELTEHHVVATSFLHNWLDFMAVATVIILFILYPTILAVCSNLLQCERLVVGGGGKEISVLVADRSIDCASSQYLRYRDLALVSLGVYGLGIPLLCIALVVAVGLVKGDLDKAKQLFFFTTGGFKSSLWFFEVVSLLRKATLVVLTQSITDEILRGALCTWSISGFFVLNLLVNPWEDAELQLLENCSLACITVTFNLMQVLVRYEKTSFQANAVGVLILAVNALIFAVFVRRLVLDAKGMLLEEAHAGSRVARFVTWVLRLRPSEDEIAEETGAIHESIAVTERLVVAAHRRLFSLYDVAEHEVRDALYFEHTSALKEEGLFVNETSEAHKVMLEGMRHQSRQLSKRHSIAEVADAHEEGGTLGKIMRLLRRDSADGGSGSGPATQSGEFALDTTAILAAPNTSISEPVFKAFTTLQMAQAMLGELSRVGTWDTMDGDPRNDAALAAVLADTGALHHPTSGSPDGGLPELVPSISGSGDGGGSRRSPPPLGENGHVAATTRTTATGDAATPPHTVVAFALASEVLAAALGTDATSSSNSGRRGAASPTGHADNHSAFGVGPTAFPRRDSEGVAGAFDDSMEGGAGFDRVHESASRTTIPRPTAHLTHADRLEMLADDIGRVKASDALESVFNMEIAIVEKIVASVQRRKAVELARINGMRNRRMYNPEEDD